ncbi:MAG: flagellar biosynthetic protein FliR, partial [Bdellovibrionota bacterium]
KVLLSLAVTVALFPVLVSSGSVNPGEAQRWAATTGGIVSTISMEVILALILGFTAKMIFETINFGGNLVGNFMGLASASTFDPHQESQTQVAAELQMAIAMLLFLAMDGHHLLLKASLDSYHIVGIGGFAALGKSVFGSDMTQRLVHLSAQVIAFGLELAAPVALSMFVVNAVFGIMSKAMPSMNILILSFSVLALVGMFVMWLEIPVFHDAVAGLFTRMGESMEGVMQAMAHGK